MGLDPSADRSPSDIRRDIDSPPETAGWTPQEYLGEGWVDRRRTMRILEIGPGGEKRSRTVELKAPYKEPIETLRSMADALNLDSQFLKLTWLPLRDGRIIALLSGPAATVNQVAPAGIKAPGFAIQFQLVAELLIDYIAKSQINFDVQLNDKAKADALSAIGDALTAIEQAQRDSGISQTELSSIRARLRAIHLLIEEDPNPPLKAIGELFESLVHYAPLYPIFVDIFVRLLSLKF
ncbi:MAG: hypothetical protein KDE14_03255 [Rhodobacteraceae bacterium]|nr:hypothetical protein [Paracoccaceae bacterium]